MNEIKPPAIDLPKVRLDYVPVSDYGAAATRLENERLWPRVWQVACREESIANPGSFETYNVAGQSIIVLRNDHGEIKAFHNVCPHRGRELTSGCGALTKIHCGFHGWQWDLNGEILRLPDRDDWAGCPNMADKDLHLAEVKVGTWGGWVFINMDPHCESFAHFIDPIPQYLDCLEFDKMRYSWRKRFVIHANWKIAMESFMESYHVTATHPQALALVDPANFSSAHGKHGRHAYFWERPLGTPAKSTGLPVPEDLRPGLAALGVFNAEQLGCTNVPGGKDSQMTERSNQALQRHLTDTPAGVPHAEVQMRSVQYMKEAAEAEGAGWPVITAAQAAELGADWNIFPNMVLVHSLDATLVFRAVPEDNDPESCLFEMASIGRHAPGKEPTYAVEYFDDWHASLDKIPYLLTQDLSNIEAIQRGIRSIAITGMRINPKQETQISHHHQVLHSYLQN
jgi:phenylpropionate dioxygenase-like ring-hydroxylating dioxygenase large terminal subunit